jgi:polyisoprenoid-binding protein YceI
MRRSALAVSLALLTLSAQAANVSTDPKQAPAGTYQMETRHTQIVFAIKHQGITDYYGRFEKYSGSLTYNPGAPEKSAVSVTIDTSSANVMNSEVMAQLVGPAVFDAGKFPTATFVSKSIERTGPTTGRMTGELTLHGVTRPVVLDVTFNGGFAAAMGGPGYDIGFHATTTIKRSDFGLDKMMWTGFVSDEVKLTIEAMFVQAKG